MEPDWRRATRGIPSGSGADLSEVPNALRMSFLVFQLLQAGSDGDPYRMRPQANVAALLRRAMRGSRCWPSVIPQHVNYSLVVGGYVAVVVDLGGERSCRAGRSQPGHFGLGGIVFASAS